MDNGYANGKMFVRKNMRRETGGEVTLIAGVVGIKLEFLETEAELIYGLRVKTIEKCSLKASVRSTAWLHDPRAERQIGSAHARMLLRHTHAPRSAFEKNTIVLMTVESEVDLPFLDHETMHAIQFLEYPTHFEIRVVDKKRLENAGRKRIDQILLDM